MTEITAPSASSHAHSVAGWFAPDARIGVVQAWLGSAVGQFVTHDDTQ